MRQTLPLRYHLEPTVLTLPTPDDWIVAEDHSLQAHHSSGTLVNYVPKQSITLHTGGMDSIYPGVGMSVAWSWEINWSRGITIEYYIPGTNHGRQLGKALSNHENRTSTRTEWIIHDARSLQRSYADEKCSP